MPRKEKKYHFIYKTTNTLTGRYYIGMHSTNDLEDGYLGSGKRLRYSIRKYGAENHIREILEFCDSREELSKRENEIVTLNEIAKEECMNLKIGGEGGGMFRDEKHRYDFLAAGGRKNSKMASDAFLEKLKDKEFREFFKKRCKETNPKSFLGKNHTEETKQKMSEKAKKRIGSKNSQFGTCWITNGTENKKIKKEDLELWESKGYSKGRK